MSASADSLTISTEAAVAAYTAEGMPALDMSGRQTSFFEFWPAWMMYLPVIIQSCVLALWHRSLTLPLIANPYLPLSGMVGVGKSELFSQAEGKCREAILPWFLHTRSSRPLAEQIEIIQHQMASLEISYPVVCKPDIGCRGTGVKLLHGEDELLSVLDQYPVGAGALFQKVSAWIPEAGVFYVRDPLEPEGRIISLALKYIPFVVGDGRRSLRQLITSDPRAGQLDHLYLKRHAARLDEVIPDGQPFRLIFAASHSRGAIFRDATSLVTPQLTAAINEVMKDLPEFYYGRLDVKFRDIAHFMRGETLQIVEINSASSEPLHIWDRRTSLLEALRSLLYQYRLLFHLGAVNRRRGYVTPKLGTLLKAWDYERELTRTHPDTD